MGRQQGSVLVVAMIFLVILTLMGLAGMEVTALEEKMAGNQRDRHIAFQAAEAALAEAQASIAGWAAAPEFPTDGSNNGGHLLATTSGKPAWERVDWEDATEVIRFRGTGYDQLAQPPAYVIEYMHSASGAEELVSIGVGEIKEEASIYRVTARARGSTAASMVMLQITVSR